MTILEDAVDYDHLALYDEKIKQVISTKADDSDVIKGVTVGGSAVTPSSGVVALGSAAGSTSANTVANDSTLPTGAAVQSYVSAAISGAVVGAYTAGGSKAASEITVALLVSANLGKVYNLTTELVISDADKANFVENIASRYPAGSNVVVVNVGTSADPSFKFDVLSGFIDLSGYVQASDISIVTNSQINALFE